MICLPCREGGDMLERARGEPHPLEQAFCQRLARAAHAHCEAPTTCPCHHLQPVNPIAPALPL